MKTNKITNKTSWTDNYYESEKQEFVKKSSELSLPEQFTPLTLKIHK